VFYLQCEHIAMLVWQRSSGVSLLADSIPWSRDCTDIFLGGLRTYDPYEYSSLLRPD
jgi:hypothetical protein